MNTMTFQVKIPDTLKKSDRGKNPLLNLVETICFTKDTVDILHSEKLRDFSMSGKSTGS